MALIQISAPTQEPVTLSEVKRHLRIPSTSMGGTSDEDNLIESYIKAARHQAENYMKRQIMDASWQLIMRDFPNSTGHIELPRPPLTTVSTEIVITYVDSSNATQTVPSTAYTIDYKSLPPRIYPSYDNSWSTFSVIDMPNAVTVQYVSGYSSGSSSTSTSVSSTDVPDAIKTWIMMKVGMLYHYREPVTSEDFRNIPRDHFNGLLDSYAVISVST